MLSKVCVARFPGFPPTIMYLAFSFIWQRTEKIKNYQNTIFIFVTTHNVKITKSISTLIECKKWQKASFKELHCVENNY